MVQELGHLGPRAALGVVVGLYLLLACATVMLVPPYETKDESDHVHNVETVVGGHYYRIPPSLHHFVGFEPQQPPLYYVLLAAWQKLEGEPAFTPSVVPKHTTGFVVTPQPGQAAYQHTTRLETADGGRVRGLRIIGVLLGALTILLTAAAARSVARDRWTPVIAAAVVAFVPRFISLSAAVTNDNLANTIAAAATAVGAVAVSRPGMTARQKQLVAASLGFLLGALVMSKMSAVALAPAICVAAFLSGGTRAEGRMLVLVASATAVVTASPWLILNTAWYGDPLAIGATRAYLREFATPVTAPIREIFVELPRHVWANFWYTTGWLRSAWPWWAYLPFWALTAIGIGAATRGDGGAAVSRDPRRRAVRFFAAFALCGVAIIGILGVATPQVDARTGFVGLPAIACLAALGFERRGWALRARVVLPAALLIASLVSLQTGVLSIYY